MFEINDLVIHSREGLSKIAGINQMNGKDYFLVSVFRSSSENIYVPVENAERIIRHLMSKKEADELLSYIKGIEKEFNTNTKQRRDAYKRRLSSGSVKDIAYLYRQLYFYNLIGGEGNEEIRLGPVDIDMLSYAQNMLMDELSIVYNISREEILDFVNDRISKL